MTQVSPSAGALDKLSTYVSGIVGAQRERLVQMEELGASIASVQIYTASLEQQLGSARQQLAEALDREEGLKTLLIGEKGAREALVEAHAEKIDSLQTAHREEISRIEEEFRQKINELRLEATDAINTIREEASSAIQMAENDARLANDARALAVSENDRLNEGMTALIKVIEMSTSDVHGESNAIKEMISAIDRRLPEIDARQEHSTESDPLAFLRLKKDPIPHHDEQAA